MPSENTRPTHHQGPVKSAQQQPPKFKVGDIVHVNQDDEQWGWIAHDGEIAEVNEGERWALVNIGDYINASVIVDFQNMYARDDDEYKELVGALIKTIEALQNVPMVGDVYDQQHSDTGMRAIQQGEAVLAKLKQTEPEFEDDVPRWVDRHSVNCYFCRVLFDEREGLNADEYNGNDGGSICPSCIIKKETTDGT